MSYTTGDDGNPLPSYRWELPDPPSVSGGLGYCECGFKLCARGAQQQACQQKAGGKKSESAVLLGNHAPDYKQIFLALQAPTEPMGVPEASFVAVAMPTLRIRKRHISQTG